MNIDKAVTILMLHATGQVNHACNGLCPDVVEGPATRDPDCRVCNAINVVNAAPPIKPQPEDVTWVVNDRCEIGVKIRNRVFFFYKGEPFQYDEGVVLYRPIEPREFGESLCGHSDGSKELKQWIQERGRWDWQLVPSMGEPEPEWKCMITHPVFGERQVTVKEYKELFDQADNFNRDGDLDRFTSGAYHGYRRKV